MPAKSNDPAYCRQRRAGRRDEAYVRLSGKRTYLGRYGSKQSRDRYRQVLAEWKARGKRPPTEPARITVAEVLAAYWRHAKLYYRGPDGTPTSEVSHIKLAIKQVRELYGRIPAAEFGPSKLKAIRQAWIDAQQSRGHINHQANRVRRAFKWAVAEELVPPAVLHGLQAVDGLKQGRSLARETPGVKAVPDAWVEAVRPHVSRQVWACIELTRLTGARPSEALRMRGYELDMGGPLWEFRPSHHKNAWRGHQRVLVLGPKAQAVIRPFLRPDLSAFLFSPREATSERHAMARIHRRPNQNPNPRKTGRTIGDHYTPDSFRRAIETACRKADVPRWHPYQLRHSYGTRLRKLYGLEGAQVGLGHANADVTQVYAEVNLGLARRIAAEVG